MSLYRKKPVVIEAVQWYPNVEHPGVSEDPGKLLTDFYSPAPGSAMRSLPAYYVTTIHEQRTYLVPGDWILPEPKEGRFYPCKPDIFDATYASAKGALASADLVDRLTTFQKRMVGRDEEPELHALLGEAIAEIERLQNVEEDNLQAGEIIIELKQDKDAAYLERNQVAAALASLFPSGIARTDILGWLPEWHGCVYIDLPTGQASWHYHDSQAHLFAHLQQYPGQWDGHTTEQKYERLAALRHLQASLQDRKLWLWKNGDHFWAFDHLYPCRMDCGDPQVLGEPVGYALLKPSRPPSTGPHAEVAAA